MTNVLDHSLIQSLLEKFDIRAIVGFPKNRAIGLNNTLPWNIPEDLQFFKKTTSGKTILMGRKTYDSIGRPLPKRLNIVLSRTPTNIPNVITIDHPSKLLELDLPRDIWLIGGAKIYELLLPACIELYISHIHQDYNGDTFFPSFEENFTPAETIEQYETFHVKKYIRK